MDGFHRQRGHVGPHAAARALPRTALHRAPAGIVAALAGLVVFVTVALGHPFQGDVTPSPDGSPGVADRPSGGRSRNGGT